MRTYTIEELSDEDNIPQVRGLAALSIIETHIEELRHSRNQWRIIAVVSLLFSLLLIILQPHYECYEDNSCGWTTSWNEYNYEPVPETPVSLFTWET